MSKHHSYRPFTGTKDERYFLKEEVAKDLCPWIKATLNNHKIVVTRFEDPCAGNGVMSRHMRILNMQNFDLNKAPNIKQRDFLEHHQKHEPGLMYVMNVPYGSNSRGAIRFFNHGALFADVLAIVVPKTWERGTFNSQLNKSFHLVDSCALPKNSFYLPEKNNKSHNVPSICQIWQRRDYPRIDKQKISRSKFIAAHQNRGVYLDILPNIAIRRVGHNAGEIVVTGFDELTPAGWWFVYINKSKNRVVDAINNIDWSQYGNGMAQRSISKTELIQAIESLI